MGRERTRRQKALRRAGIALFTGALLVPLVIMLISTPADRLDSWQDDAEEGDSTFVLCRIEGETHTVPDYYLYDIEGSDVVIYSKEDIGEEGEYVLLNLEKGDQYLTVEAKYSLALILIPILMFLAFGTLLFFLGSRDIGGQTPAADDDARFCSRCGFLLEYLGQYGRWYCYKCRSYEDNVLSGTPVQDPPADKTRCPECGKVFPAEKDDEGAVVCPSCGTRGFL